MSQQTNYLASFLFFRRPNFWLLSVQCLERPSIPVSIPLCYEEIMSPQILHIHYGLFRFLQIFLPRSCGNPFQPSLSPCFISNRNQPPFSLLGCPAARDFFLAAYFSNSPPPFSLLFLREELVQMSYRRSYSPSRDSYSLQINIGRRFLRC